MLSRFLILCTALASTVAAAPYDVLFERQTSECQDIHMFLARGAGDSYPGTSGSLPPLVCKGLTSCGFDNILYVGTFDKVCNSVDVGVVNATKQLNDYGAKCPNAKIVMIGHSEGCAVTLNTLGGSSVGFPGCTIKATTAQNPAVGVYKQIAAIALTGDMRHTAIQPYNTGTGAAKNGIWPRTAAELPGLKPWEDKMRSWCDSADPVCADGSDVSAHGAYMSKVGPEMATWIRGRVGVAAAL